MQFASCILIFKSGGDYAYIHEAFGPLPAFLYLWAALLVIIPAGNAITALTFANYLLQPFWPECDPPVVAARLIAALVICEKLSVQFSFTHLKSGAATRLARRFCKLIIFGIFVEFHTL